MFPLRHDSIYPNMKKYPYLDGQMLVHICLDTLIQWLHPLPMVTQISNNVILNSILIQLKIKYLKKFVDLKFAKVYIQKKYLSFSPSYVVLCVENIFSIIFSSWLSIGCFFPLGVDDLYLVS